MNHLKSIPEIIDLAQTVVDTKHRVLGDGPGKELITWINTEKLLAIAVLCLSQDVVSYYPGVPLTRKQFESLPRHDEYIPKPEECMVWIKQNDDDTFGIWRYVNDGDGHRLEIGTVIPIDNLKSHSKR